MSKYQSLSTSDIDPEALTSNHSTSSGHSHDHSHNHDGCDHDHSHEHSHGQEHHDHGHGHKHGPNCNHQHGKKKGKKWHSTYSLQIKTFVYGTVFLGWVIVTFWFLESIYRNDPVKYNIHTGILTVVIFMSLLSYYKCSTAFAGNTTKNVPAFAPQDNQQMCEQCQKWKPERSHHCSVCGVCVIKMDHHCPWICTCVGYKNHKAFWLFCFYTAIAGIIFDYRCIQFLYSEADHGTLFSHSWLFYIWWLYQSIAIFPFGLMVTGLTVMHFFLAMNNQTTLESMGGYNMRTCCVSDEAIQKRMVNFYDKGLLSNLCDFFGNSPWTWFWPDLKEYNYFGQIHEKTRPATPLEVVEHLRGPNYEPTPEEKLTKPQSITQVDVRQILMLAQEFTKDKQIQFMENMFEIGKRRDNTFKREIAAAVQVSVNLPNGSTIISVQPQTSAIQEQPKPQEIQEKSAESFFNPIMVKSSNSEKKINTKEDGNTSPVSTQVDTENSQQSNLEHQESASINELSKPNESKSIENENNSEIQTNIEEEGNKQEVVQETFA